MKKKAIGKPGKSREHAFAEWGDGVVDELARHLLILSQSKRVEMREFYLRMAIRDRCGKREFERQFRAALFESAVLNPPKVSAQLTNMHPAATERLLEAKRHEFNQMLDELAGENAPAATKKTARAQHEAGYQVSAGKNDCCDSVTTIEHRPVMSELRVIHKKFLSVRRESASGAK